MRYFSASRSESVALKIMVRFIIFLSSVNDYSIYIQGT